MTKTNSIVAKLSVAVVAVAMAFTLVAPSAKAQDVSSMSLEQLVALVNQLQGQLSGSATVGNCSFTFTRSLGQGSTGADVMNLQKFLNMSADTQVAAAGSAGGPGSETSYYGPATAAAVSKFQVKYSADILVPVGLTTPTGYFGPSSMAKANAVCAGMTDGDDDDDNDNDNGGDLEGGAGDIGEAEFITSLNNEEVGEDEEDSEVAGLDIEADGSDIEITSVAVNFDYADTGASDDFDDYATEVSIWLDGEEYARIDVDEMDDDDWSENISLDNGAIIREGETGELVVAVTGADNIDGSDIGENWNVAFESVRFRDAQDAVVTDSTTGDIGGGDDDATTDDDEREFSFESFATSADVELSISSGSDEINDARTIQVEDDDSTDEVEIFSFMAEVEGDSDLSVEDIAVMITTIEAAGTHFDEPGDIVTEAILFMDGEEVGSESLSGTADGDADEQTVTFDGVDLELSAGEEYEFVVAVNLVGTDDALDNGDKIAANVGSTELDAWDVEDETGESLDDELTGSASSDDHTLMSEGLFATGPAEADSDADETIGTFTFDIELQAFEDDMYVSTSTGDDDDGVGFDWTVVGGTATTSATVQSDASVEGGYYRIDEGETETFTIVVTVDPAASGSFYVVIDDVNYAIGAAGVATAVHEFDPQSDFDATAVAIQGS